MEKEDISKLKIDKHPKRPIYKRGRYIYWIGAIAVLVIIAYLAKSVLSTPTVRASTVALTYPSQSLTVLNASGYVVAQRKASVASKTTGRLVWLGVEEGSNLKKGEIIARLENEDVTAAREQASATLNVASKNLEQARAELEDAEANYNRNKELFERGFISRSVFDAAEARYKKALAAVDAANATVNANRAALKGASVSVEYTLIRAPFDGVVLTKNADIGDIITPLGAAANAKAAVVTIADLDSLQVETDVSESNIGRVRMNMPCEIQLDALPDKRFNGEVHMIVPTADRTKASVLVKVRFLEKDPRILPEMSAKVAFLSRPLNQAEETPRTGIDPAAIVTKNGNKFVYKIEGAAVIETPVQTGAKVGDFVEVISGVKPGEKVVLNPPKGVKNGSKIKLTEE
ncbi:MAG: efflux RND transporter periplasmic adaptor subunit [Deltaproteobacteria bacterium]|nr:efflux RND transporter periplasmic adaptor subunit [Deltaproteobacteria bacterium]